MAEREEIMKLGVDASQVTPALRSIIAQLGQYNRSVQDVSNATVRFNRDGTASRVTLTSLDKAGNSLTQTFKVLKDGIRQTSAALTENKNAQEQALRAMVRNQEEQKRLARDNFQAQRQQTRDWQNEIMRRMRVADEERNHRAKLHATMRADERRHNEEMTRAARVAARDAAVARANLPGSQFATGLRSGFLRAGPPLLTGAVAAGSGSGGSLMGGLGGLAGGLAGTVATMAVGAAIGALTSTIGAMARAWKDATIASAEFQKQIALIRTISQDSQLNMTKWQDGIIKLSNQFGRSKEEIATGVYETLSAQIAKGADSFLFMEEAMKLASVTGADARQAVSALAAVMNSYHMNASEAARVSSIFFKSIDLGRGNISVFSDNIGRLTQMSAFLGVRFEELGAAWATLTTNGTESHTAITQMTNVLLQLQKPSEAMVKLFHSMGVENAQQALAARGYLGVMAEINKAVRDQKFGIEELFPELRAQQGALGAMAGNLEVAERNLRLISDAQGDYNTAVREYSETAGVRFDRDVETMKNKLHELGDTTLRLAYVFRNDLMAAMTALSPTTVMATAAVMQWLDGMRQALPMLEALDAARSNPTVSSGANPAQKAKEELSAALRERYEETNAHVNAMRAKLFEMNDAEAASLKETRENLKAEMEVRLDAFNQLNQNLEKYISKLERSKRSISEVANEIRSIRSSNFNDTRNTAGLLETTDPNMRRNIDTIFRNNPQDIQSRLGVVMRDLQSARRSGNPEGVRQNFDDLRAIWQEQIQFQAELFNRTQNVGVLVSIRNIQQLINNSRWDELGIVERMAALDQQRAERARAVLQEDRVKVKEMKKASGRLDEMKPEDFRSIAEASSAFDRIANPMIEKARTMGSAEAMSLAETLMAQREMFLTQVRQRVALDELTKVQSRLQEEYNKANQEIMNTGLLMSNSFEQAESAVDAATAALVRLRTELGQIPQNIGARVGFDLKNEQLQGQRTVGQQGAAATDAFMQQTDFDAQNEAIWQAMQDPNFALDPEGTIGMWQTVLSDPNMRKAMLGYDRGGLIGGRGGVDNNVIRASDGEFMMNSRATRMFYPQIVAMNAAGLGGGGVGGDSNSFGDINVTVNGGRTTDETARSIGYAVRREMRRGTLNLRRK